MWWGGGRGEIISDIAALSASSWIYCRRNRRRSAGCAADIERLLWGPAVGRGSPGYISLSDREIPSWLRPNGGDNLSLIPHNHTKWCCSFSSILFTNLLEQRERGELSFNNWNFYFHSDGRDWQAEVRDLPGLMGGGRGDVRQRNDPTMDVKYICTRLVNGSSNLVGARSRK